MRSVRNPYQLYWNDVDDQRGFHILDTETFEMEYILNPYTIITVLSFLGIFVLVAFFVKRKSVSLKKIIIELNNRDIVPRYRGNVRSYYFYKTNKS